MLVRRVPQLLGIGFFCCFYACGTAESDPRAGELGRVTFTGGGGCNSSTTLAVGSRTTLTLEPLGGATLPSGLEVRSTDAAVINAAAGTRSDRLVVGASRAGDAQVELRSGGELWDRLRFSAEPAARVELDKPAARVFAGATLVLKLGEVYGACGKDCPLIGGGFLKWTATPAAGLSVLEDVERNASFAAGSSPGQVTLRGSEPGAGQVLVDHQLAIVPVKDAGPLAFEAIVALPEDAEGRSEVLDPAPTPLEVPAGSLMLVRVHAAAAGQRVPIWGRDLTWTIEGDPGAVTLYPLNGQPPPAEGPIFSADKPGKATLVGQAALLGKTIRIQVTVSAG
jgi:hypothetical protein